MKFLRNNVSSKRKIALKLIAKKNTGQLLIIWTTYFTEPTLIKKITLVSPSGLQYTNFTDVDELIGKDVIEMFYDKPSDREKSLKALQDNNGAVTNYEVQLRVKSHQVIPFETNSHFVFDQHGNIAGIEGMLRNITEQKADEQAITKWIFSIF